MIETTACPGVLAEIFALLDKKKVIPFSTATQVGPDGNRLEIETGVLEESTIMALLPALRRMPAVRNAQLRRSVPAPAPTVCAEI
ncbi:hypothetical protein [Sphingopyxis terrae]|uniref:hypothetical protein n=1 Tax=Sphingopyxis terrae TaxID=33052 RepID=UPI002A12950B|nr:hypothetical protein [Sphingopyxis terrae]MDX8356505.1 hypothetical protein [Sphingopyxis terrae]